MDNNKHNKCDKFCRCFFVMFALFLSFFSVSAQSCFFDTFNESCERILTPYNTFEVTGVSLSDVSRFDVEIFNVANVGNKIKVSQTDLNVEQITPFLEPGVYDVSVLAYDKAGNVLGKEFEYVFDNLEPMPPVVPLGIEALGGSVSVDGFCDAGLRIVAEFGNTVLEGVCNSSGDFSLDLAGLDSGVNYVKFYTKKSDGVKSALVERVVVSDAVAEDEGVCDLVSSVSLADLNSLNERTVLGVTSKRNFYVQGAVAGSSGSSGSSLGGAVVYVNGVKTVADSSGKFGAFVLLNEGDNKIVAVCGGHNATFDVRYVKLNFQFLAADFEKVVNTDSVRINGSVSFDYPFLVFLNGEFVKEITSSSGEFDFVLSGLESGKNFVELRGVFGERFSDIVYYDTEVPVVDFLGESNLANARELVFEIKDDVGIDVNSIDLEIGGLHFGVDSVSVLGDFYVFNVSSALVSDGVYGFELKGVDLSGKSFSLATSVSVLASHTLLEEFVVGDLGTDGYVIGDRIFLKDGDDVELNIVPSRNVAFESIFLDGVEQIDYEILKDKSVRLFVDIDKRNGSLVFNFINTDYESFTQEFEYVSDIEEPVLELDYVEKSSSVDKIKLSGKIVDSHFDWSSLEFNGDASFRRFGDFFEVLIDAQTGRLAVSGSDYSRNPVVGDFESLMLYEDTSSSEVVLDSLSSLDYVSGSLYSDDESVGNFNFLSSYDGFDLNKVYLSADGFKLPLQERFGVRGLAIEGFESSGMKFFYDSSFVVDPLKPEIYFVEDTYNNVYKVLIDGTLSEIVSYEILVDGVFADLSECYDEVSAFTSCFIIDDDVSSSVAVSATDSAGNFNSKTFFVSGVTDDTDGDGILDADDPDVNGDGVVDQFEDDIGDGSDDTDDDGILDIDDEDIDGDGILNGDDPDVNGDDSVDQFEDDIGDGSDDTDDDGILDIDDEDIDGDGILNGDDPDVNGDDSVDQFEDDIGDGSNDTDGDGILDIDDDDIDGDDILNGDDSSVADDSSDGSEPIDDVIDTVSDFLNFYFSGNDLTTVNPSYFIGGTIESDLPVETVLVIGGDECVFDDVSFSCPVGLTLGVNDFDVKVVDNQGNYVVKSFSVELLESNLFVSIDDILGDDVYKANGMYYLFGDSFEIEGSVSSEALVKVLINSEVSLENLKDGSFSFDIDVSDIVNGEDEKEISVQLEVDDTVNKGFSERVVLMYKKAWNSFVRIVVN